MHKYGRILTSGGICVGEAVRTKNGKLALLVKQSKKNFFDIITLEELGHQVLLAVEKEKNRV